LDQQGSHRFEFEQAHGVAQLETLLADDRVDEEMTSYIEQLLDLFRVEDSQDDMQMV
jgi:hypothetical protein